MKNVITILTLVCLASFSSLQAQDSDVEAIRHIIDMQQEAWSNNDMKGFMEGYWKSDSLTYFSGGKITKGWQTILDNYKKRYPTKAHSGKVNFRIAEITKIEDNTYYMLGEYYLTREAGNANGTFMLVFKKINGEWKIVADSSC
ncbi:MAG: nuclear transport factor 2 family protein [Pricia sp.]|nr:nuclear transport factor 2 family protein [Pricia sp.]